MEKKLSRLYEVTGIPMCLIDSKMKLHTFPQFEENILPIEFVKNLLVDFEEKKRDEVHPLVLLIDPVFFLGVLKLSHAHYLLLGPVSPFAQAHEQITSFAINVIYPNRLREFCDMMSATPIVSYRRFLNTLSLAAQLLIDVDLETENILLCNSRMQQVETDTEVQNQLFKAREQAIKHIPQSYEEGVLTAIEMGDVALLKKRIIEPVSGRIGQMSNDALMQEKYTFVAFITMITRAAIKGGLNMGMAYSLSDIYCQQMDAMKSVQDITALIYHMALDFCKKVSKYGKNKQYAPATKRLCDYISLHLHENMTLDTLSKFCGRNKKSMSKNFYEDTGYTIPAYIHHQKMLEAVHLLRNTQYSISDIGMYLNYCSQSYFTKIFRDSYGVTPMQYRDNILLNSSNDRKTL